MPAALSLAPADSVEMQRDASVGLTGMQKSCVHRHYDKDKELEMKRDATIAAAVIVALTLCGATSAYDPATNPNPPDGAVDVNEYPRLALSWDAAPPDSPWVASYNLYYGTDSAVVQSGITPRHSSSAPSMRIGPLTPGTLYYWKVDIYLCTTRPPFMSIYIPGDLWQFTTAPRSPIAEPNLVAHWKCDEGGGSAAHDSAGNNDATIHEVDRVGGFLGDALEFDGAAAHARVADSNSLDIAKATFSAWLHIDRFGPETAHLLAKSEDSDVENSYRIWLDAAGLLHLEVEDIAHVKVETVSDQPVGLGQWLFITATYDRGDSRLYLDGSEVATHATGLSVETLYQGAGRLAIGARYSTGQGGYTSFFDGVMDDIRIYNTALSPSQIEQLYGVRGCTFYVDAVDGNDTNDGLTSETAFATIRKGLDSAGHKETVIVAPGTYTGSGNKNLGFAGRAITLKSTEGPYATVIDCENSGHGFYLGGGERPDSIIDGFTITNGNTTYGGAMEIWHAFPTIRNCIFSRNHARSAGGRGGAALYCISAGPRIFNCVFEDNSTPGDGGAIFNHRGLTQVVNSTFIGNEADDGAVAFCYRYSDVSIVNSIARSRAEQSSDNFLAAVQSTLRLANSNIEGGPGRAWDDGIIIDDGGNIDEDPLFADVNESNYRLLAASPCIETGTNDDPKTDLPPTDIVGRSRTIDGNGDETSVVDMGAHEYDPSMLWDLNGDRLINFEDLRILGYYWSGATCSHPRWCQDSDFDKNGAVGPGDLVVLCGSWLLDPD